jgi:hypothetical protein
MLQLATQLCILRPPTRDDLFREWSRGRLRPDLRKELEDHAVTLKSAPVPSLTMGSDHIRTTPMRSFLLVTRLKTRSYLHMSSEPLL